MEQILAFLWPALGLAGLAAAWVALQILGGSAGSDACDKESSAGCCGQCSCGRNM